MARMKTSQSALGILKRQASRVLTSLRREISQKEKELATLRQDVQRLQGIVNGKGAVPSGVPRVRLDWNIVLKDLPDTFSSKDVAAKSGKPMEQVYAGLNRWIKDRKVKKGKEGYQKVGSAASK